MNLSKQALCGSICNLTPLIFLLTGCVFSDWSCSGDNMGGVMLLYSLTIAIPNLILIFIFLIWILFSLKKEKLKQVKWHLFFYVLTLIALIFSLKFPAELRQ